MFLDSPRLWKSDPETSQLYLEPLTWVKPAKTFEVYLPWEEDECAAEDHTYPFRLVSRNPYRGLRSNTITIYHPGSWGS